MTLKIKCSYVAEGEPFTLGNEYDIYFSEKDDNGIRFEYPREDEEPEPEKDIKKEIHELLDKATELIYNNQEELNIKFDDFITLVRIKEETK